MYKKILSATLCVALLSTGIYSLNASANFENPSISQANTGQKVQAPSEIVPTELKDELELNGGYSNNSPIKIEIKGIKEMTLKLKQCVSVGPRDVNFDRNHALKLGLNEQQVENLTKTYDQINNSIINGETTIYQTASGNYNISLPKVKTKVIPQVGYVSFAVKTKRYYGWDVFFSPTECADLEDDYTGAAIIYGAATALLTACGGIPFSIVTAMAGSMALLNAVFYKKCSRHKGANVSYVFGQAFTSQVK